MHYKHHVWISIPFFVSALFAMEKVKLETLPAPVQESVRQQIKSSTLIAITKEREKGKLLYEVETKNANGRTRDFLMDTGGTVVESEEQVELDSIPLPARTAIQERSAGRTIQKVEKLTRGSSISYEAAVRNKNGRTSEIMVGADGAARKN